MTNAPQMRAGLFSAAKMGTVEPLRPVYFVNIRNLNEKAGCCHTYPDAHQKTSNEKLFPRLCERTTDR